MKVSLELGTHRMFLMLPLFDLNRTVVALDRENWFGRVLRHIIHEHKATGGTAGDKISGLVSFIPGEFTDTDFGHGGVSVFIDGFEALEPVLVVGVELHDFDG